MNILVVDDELGLRHTLTLILEGEGHHIRAAGDGEQALAMLAEQEADLVLCDVRMPKLDGLGFIERYRRVSGRALVIVMSAYGDDEAALDAMKRGAYDFIQKPFRADQVILTLNKAIEREGLRRQVQTLEERLAALQAPRGIVGSSAPLRQALDLAQKVARHPSPVLITGGGGTGKEMIARLMHAESPRQRGPFVTVDCGAIPEALLEGELFGADDRAGLFEQASGGTLLLDEIGTLPAAVQVTLLRVLQEGEVRRVGEKAARPVDVRVIATTSRDLEDAVREKRFRADLLYRINVVRIPLAPLRDRRDDIPLLVHHFVAAFNRKLSLRIDAVTPAAMRLLADYPWPGNVRELENVIERAMILAEGSVVDVAQLPDAVRSPGAVVSEPESSDLSVKRRVAALERTLIERALERTHGNRTRAAKLLELSPRALLYKIKEYGLE